MYACRFRRQTGRCLCKRSLLRGLSELGLPDLSTLCTDEGLAKSTWGDWWEWCRYRCPNRGSFTLSGLFFVTFRLDMNLPCKNLVI